MSQDIRVFFHAMKEEEVSIGNVNNRYQHPTWFTKAFYDKKLPSTVYAECDLKFTNSQVASETEAILSEGN